MKHVKHQTEQSASDNRQIYKNLHTDTCWRIFWELNVHCSRGYLWKQNIFCYSWCFLKFFTTAIGRSDNPKLTTSYCCELNHHLLLLSWEDCSGRTLLDFMGTISRKWSISSASLCRRHTNGSYTDHPGPCLLTASEPSHDIFRLLYCIPLLLNVYLRRQSVSLLMQRLVLLFPCPAQVCFFFLFCNLGIFF